MTSIFNGSYGPGCTHGPGILSIIVEQKELTHRFQFELLVTSFFGYDNRKIKK